MKKASWSQRLRYKFDKFISKGGTSIFLSLVAAFLVVLVLIGGLRVAIFVFFRKGPRPSTAF